MHIRGEKTRIGEKEGKWKRREWERKSRERIEGGEGVGGGERGEGGEEGKGSREEEKAGKG